MLAASNVGAVIDADALPRSTVLARQSVALQRLCVLAGGDDYELLFTAPASQRGAIEAVARLVGVPVTRFGHIDAAAGLQVVDSAGRTVEMSGGVTVACFTASSSIEPATKGRCPVTIS